MRYYDTPGLRQRSMTGRYLVVSVMGGYNPRCDAFESYDDAMAFVAAGEHKAVIITWDGSDISGAAFVIEDHT